MEKRRWVLVGCAMAVAGLLQGVASKLSMRGDSIDVNTGRCRREVTVCGLPVWRKTTETPLSLAYRSLIGEPPAPDWRQESRYSWPWPGMVAYPAYHGAFFDANVLANYLQSEKFTDEARRAAILKFLSLLSHSKNRARDYTEEILELLVAKSGGKILVSDLPDP